MSSISSILSSSSYASSDYQSTAPKTPSSGGQASTPSTAPTEDSIQLSPAGHAALQDGIKSKPTHAQLVLEAEGGNPVAKATLKTEKAQTTTGPVKCSDQ